METLQKHLKVDRAALISQQNIERQLIMSFLKQKAKIFPFLNIIESRWDKTSEVTTGFRRVSLFVERMNRENNLQKIIIGRGCEDQSALKVNDESCLMSN